MGETETSELEISKEKPIIGQIMLRGDERPEQLKDKINWTAVGDYELEDENGIKVTFRHVYHDAKTIVIFIRVSSWHWLYDRFELYFLIFYYII